MKLARWASIFVLGLSAYALTAQLEAYNRTISFSGFDWRVKSSTGKVDPGPNTLSDNTKNI